MSADHDEYPAQMLRDILLPSLKPCDEFAGVCSGLMRWEPQAVHVPRGWQGATEVVEAVQLVLVTAEPGDPADGESYNLETAEDRFTACSHFARRGLEVGLLRGARPTPFHRNMRLIIDLCWPTYSFAEQMQRTWITPTVLCSASISGGSIPLNVENVCGAKYLIKPLDQLPSGFVVALGKKAGDRLRRAGRPAHFIA